MDGFNPFKAFRADGHSRGDAGNDREPMHEVQHAFEGLSEEEEHILPAIPNGLGAAKSAPHGDGREGEDRPRYGPE